MKEIILFFLKGFLDLIMENIKQTIKQIEETIDDTRKNNSTDDNDEKIISEFEQQKEKLNNFITRVESCKNLSSTFHFEIDDPSGNSFIENPNAPHRDDQMTIKKYRRTPEQNSLLGIDEEEEETTINTEENNSNFEQPDSIKDEVLRFSTNCPSCNSPCDTNMKLTQIPYFKEVIIMATSCDVCGEKSNEVKSGSGIAPQGIRYKLVMNDPIDLNRDILVSETASFAIPDLDFELSSSKSIGGRFTTLEGIFTTLKTQLTSVIMPFSGGDSRASNSDENHMASFINHITKILAGEKFVTVVLDDPAGNCYFQNICAPDPDPQLTVEHYERTEEQNELLGLTDMKVENYAQT
jgi:zinc finger protein